MNEEELYKRVRLVRLRSDAVGLEFDTEDGETLVCGFLVDDKRMDTAYKSMEHAIQQRKKQ